MSTLRVGNLTATGGTGTITVPTGNQISQVDYPSGLVLVKSQTIGSAVSTVTVSDVFSSEFDNYKVVFGATDASLDDQAGLLTFGSTSTGYYGSLVYDKYDGSASTIRRNNSSSIYAGITDSTNATNFQFDVFSPNLAQRTTVSGMGFGYSLSFWFGGMVANSTQYTAFTWAPSSGTVTGGTIRVYGYRNS
jgi:hypothetical protein